MIFFYIYIITIFILIIYKVIKKDKYKDFDSLDSKAYDLLYDNLLNVLIEDEIIYVDYVYHVDYTFYTILVKTKSGNEARLWIENKWYGYLSVTDTIYIQVNGKVYTNKDFKPDAVPSNKTKYLFYHKIESNFIDIFNSKHILNKI